MKFYKHLKDNQVLCELCPNYCVLSKGQISSCNARQNINGEMISLTYEKPCAINIDPVEKKPLYHYLPGSKTLSIGTAGCNLHCKNCQNYHISQENPDNIKSTHNTAEQIVELALKNNCKSISYTYNEPTVFYEYMYEIAKLAKASGLKNIMVSNGYINSDPLMEIAPYIDAANIDLKCFKNVTYKSLFKGELKYVLETISKLFKYNVWIEITNLVIPEKTDNLKMIEEMCDWIVKNVTGDTPLHFSRFFPLYNMQDLYPTPVNTILKACKIAKNKGIKYVYTGNVKEQIKHTVCPNCNNILIRRNGFDIDKINIKNSECENCNHQISGVWE